VLFEAPLEQNFCVMTDDIGLAVTVHSTDGPCALILDLICRKKDSLAEKVGQHIKRANELHAPIKSVQYVSLLRDKLIVREGNANVL
jgi:hypothetical protein